MLILSDLASILWERVKLVESLHAKAAGYIFKKIFDLGCLHFCSTPKGIVLKQHNMDIR